MQQTHPHEAALALIGLFQEGESVADFQEGDFLEGGSDRGGCIIMMCDVCVFVCFVVSGVAPARIQQICRNIYNLGINTTLSRKLLTSKPDTKIGRTIVINSGQRSISLGCQTGQFLSYYARKVDISLEANGCRIFGYGPITHMLAGIV